MYLDRIEFGRAVTSRNMSKFLVARPPCDWSAVSRLSHGVDVTILIGGTDGPGCEAATLDQIAAPVVWVPDSEKCVSDTVNWEGRGVKKLVRQEFELDSVVLSGAPLVRPEVAESIDSTVSNVTASGRDAPTSLDASLTDAAGFTCDAAWLSDIEGRRPEDGALCIAITAGIDEPLTEQDVGSGIDDTLRRIGIHIRREMILTGEAARNRVLMRRTREAMARYVTVHITPESISLPQMPMLPFAIRGKRLLGARLPILEHPGEGIRVFALADLLYTTTLRFPGKAASDVAHLRQHVLAWCHVVLFVVREIAGRGFRAAVEALPIEALSSDEHIAISVLVEGITDDEGWEFEADLDKVVRASSFYSHVHVDVIPVPSLDEACGAVRTLDRSAIEMIHAALIDDGRLLPSDSGLIPNKHGDRSETDEPASDAQRVEGVEGGECPRRSERAERNGAWWCANRYTFAPRSSEPEGGLVDVETVIDGMS
jgi:hypothetical protein